jgi:hypothetical protein
LSVSPAFSVDIGKPESAAPAGERTRAGPTGREISHEVTPFEGDRRDHCLSTAIPLALFVAA